MNDRSNVHISQSGTVTYEGDAVKLFQAQVVRSRLRACKIGLRLKRSYTPTNCLRTASTFTGKKYGRGNSALDAAIEDMSQWISACEAAMPMSRD